MMQRVALAFAASLLAACSVIAGGGSSDGQWRCSLESGDLCQEVAPPGERWRCDIAAGESEGVCAACAPVDVCGNGLDDDCDGTVDNGSPETCNEADDDCDGTVDEGLDEDEDGFTWCPTGPTPQDCDDSNDRVHPARDGEPPPEELCDGVDNDCNGGTPDGSGQCSEMQDCDSVQQQCVDINCATRPSLCAADQFCDEDAVPPSCEPRDMTCFNPAFQCPDGQVCNPATADCVVPQPNGTPCDFDAQCASSLCIPFQSLRADPGHVMDMNGVCGRTCCTDEQCDAGQRCWASGTGARACVPETLLAMGSFGVPTTEICSAKRDCGAEECELLIESSYTVTDRLTLACGNRYRARRSCAGDFDCCYGPFCPFSGYADCIDGFCANYECGGASDCHTGICAGSTCRNTCATSEDCAGGGACVYIFARAGAASRNDYAPACSYNVSGRGAGGQACTADTDCLDRTCVDATGDPEPQPDTPMACRDTCCADSSCQAGEQCRPIFVHGQWENHCLPEPLFARTPPMSSTTPP